MWKWIINYIILPLIIINIIAPQVDFHKILFELLRIRKSFHDVSWRLYTQLYKVILTSDVKVDFLEFS